MARDTAGFRKVAAWWRARSPKGRQRIMLGSLMGVAVAARDVMLLGLAGGMLAALELAPEVGPAPARSAA